MNVREGKDPHEASGYELEPEVAPAQPAKPPAPTPAPVRVVDVEPVDDGDEEPPQVEPLVSTRLVSWKLWGGVGAGLTLLAAVMAFRAAEKNAFAHAISVVYTTLVCVALGVVAGYVAARLEGRPMGKWRELAARVWVALGAGQVCLQSSLPIPGKFEEAILALGIYLGVLMLLMGWKRERTLRVASVHFALVVIFTIALAIHTWAWRGT